MNAEQIEADSSSPKKEQAEKPKRGCFRSCLLVLGILFVVIVGGSYAVVATSSGDVYVERSILVDAPPEIVFGEVDDMRRWERWSPWTEMDPDMEFMYMAIPRGKYAGYTWKSDDDQVGSGMLMVTLSEPNQRVITDWTMNRKGRQPLKAVGDFKFIEADGGTKVIWIFRSQVQGIEKLFGAVMAYSLGSTFDRGLERLKEVSEAEVDNPTPHFVPEPVEEPEPEESSGQTGNNSPAQ